MPDPPEGVPVTAAITVLADAFERIRDNVRACVDGASQRDLAFRPDESANSAAWLIWHLTRIQDDHVAALSGRPQTWTEEGWVRHFGLPFADGDTGYGHSSRDVAQVDVPGELLLGYHEAVHDTTSVVLRGLTDEDLSRVVDGNYDPPVTMGVRLVSVIADDLQHVGQAAYVLGFAPPARS